MSPDRLPIRHYRLFSRSPVSRSGSRDARDPSAWILRRLVPMEDSTERGRSVSTRLTSPRRRRISAPAGYLPRRSTCPISRRPARTSTPTWNCCSYTRVDFRQIRVTAALNSSVSWRVAQSPKGMWVDGLEFRMVDPLAAFDAFARAGAETVRSPIWWLTEHRETTTEPKVVAMVAANQRRSRMAAGAVAVAFPALIAARWALDHSNGAAAYTLGAVGLVGAFGVPFWLRRLNRRDKLRSKHLR